jgi:hypothetical protein
MQLYSKYIGVRLCCKILSGSTLTHLLVTVAGQLPQCEVLHIDTAPNNIVLYMTFDVGRLLRSAFVPAVLCVCAVARVIYVA